MRYCRKCHKLVDNTEDFYRELCSECFYKFLLESIDNAEVGRPVFEPYKKKNKFIESIKNFFKKR